MNELQKFVAVYHKWFVSSENFIEEIIEARNIEEAQLIADANCFRKSSPFSHCAVRIVRAEVQYNPTPRKLTWCERFTGKVGK